MRGAFRVFTLHTLRTTLLLLLVLYFLFLSLNMFPAARIAQYNEWAMGRMVRGSNSVTGKISSPRRLPGYGGCFLEGQTQNSHPSSADLKNLWRYISHPPTCFRGVHMD
jgi:hypothetical protein